MNAVSTKRPPSTRKAASPLQICRELSMQARTALMSAYRLDEALQSGDTLRLTRQAIQTLELLLSDDLAEEWKPENIAEAMFDAAATIRAAATTTTDTISAERWALLDNALMLVDTAVCSLPQWKGMKPSGLEKQTAQRVKTLPAPQTEEQHSSAGTSIASGKATFFTTIKLQHACGQIICTVALLDVLAQHYDNQACWGVNRLLDTAAVQLAKAISSKDPELVVDGRVILIEALTIMAMIGDSDAAIPIHSVITLVEMVRDELDGLLPAMS